MPERKDFHIAIDYQYRNIEANQATLAEERELGVRYGIYSCQYERWVNETVVMTYSAKINDLNAQIMAGKHLIKMIIRKHVKRENVRILNYSIDAKDHEDFYTEYLAQFLDE